MIEIIMTHKDDARFQKLIALLDEELYDIYGELQKSYEKHNNVEKVEQVVLAVVNEQAVGCGGYKMYDSQCAEIKRVYVLPEHRGSGAASTIMQTLHDKAKESGYIKCLLETGEEQKAAVKLYERLGYFRINNYEPYTDMPESICYEKSL